MIYGSWINIMSHPKTITLISFYNVCPSQRRGAPFRAYARGEGTNSARLFTLGETKALTKSKVHQWSRAWVTNVGGHPHWFQNMWRNVMNSEHWLVKFKICCCMTNDDSEIRNISCNYIVFLQDFANFKTFSKAENRLKTYKRMEQSRPR
jgi:hypothetical protein